VVAVYGSIGDLAEAVEAEHGADARLDLLAAFTAGMMRDREALDREAREMREHPELVEALLAEVDDELLDTVDPDRAGTLLRYREWLRAL
jgi:hypothetical protein